jgi:hypothetical protein
MRIEDTVHTCTNCADAQHCSHQKEGDIERVCTGQMGGSPTSHMDPSEDNSPIPTGPYASPSIRESALSQYPSHLMKKVSSCSDSPLDLHASDSGTLPSGSPCNLRNNEEGSFMGSFQNHTPSAFASLQQQQQNALAAMHRSGITSMLHKSTIETVQRISSGITQLSHSDSDQLSPRTLNLVNAQMAQQARSESNAPGGINRAFCASPLGKLDPTGTGVFLLPFFLWLFWAWNCIAARTALPSAHARPHHGFSFQEVVWPKLHHN